MNRVLLGDVVQINPSTKISKGQPVKFISMDKLGPFTKIPNGYEKRKFSSGAKFTNGDTLLARITPCLENGKTAFVDFLDELEVAAGSTEFVILRNIEGLTDPDYIYYLSISPAFRDYAIKSMVGTSGRQRVQNDVLAKMELSLPPLDQQKKIANILGSLDEKIELNRRMNETLEQLGQTLFRHYFADNPETVGWKSGTLGDIIVNFDSKRKPLSSRQRAKMQGDYRYFGATSVMDHVNDYLFDGTYLLLAEDGSVMRSDGTPYLQYVWGRFWINNHAHIIQAKYPFTVEYLYLLLAKTNVQSLVSGAVQLKINQRAMNSLVISIPPDDLVIKFCNLVNSLFAQYRENEEQIELLVNLRESLLPKLISGGIEV